MSYLPDGGTIPVDMRRFVGPAVARWYDPSNGRYATVLGSPFPNSRTVEFTSPRATADGDSDCVLVLTARVGNQTEMIQPCAQAVRDERRSASSPSVDLRRLRCRPTGIRRSRLRVGRRDSPGEACGVLHGAGRSGTRPSPSFPRKCAGSAA
jgi:hypothetical protein